MFARLILRATDRSRSIFCCFGLLPGVAFAAFPLSVLLWDPCDHPSRFSIFHISYSLALILGFVDVVWHRASLTSFADVTRSERFTLNPIIVARRAWPLIPA